MGVTVMPTEIGVLRKVSKGLADCTEFPDSLATHPYLRTVVLPRDYLPLPLR